MNKTTLFYGAVLLVVYYTLVFCEQTQDNANAQLINADADTETLRDAGRDLMDIEGRTRRHRHHLFLRHLWPLAIAYWIKVKVIIVSFFVGSAIYLGLRYFWPHNRCNQEIILDHPPPSFSHDHIPYSLDHHVEHEHDHYGAASYDSSPSFEPYAGYSGYSGYSANADILSDIQGDVSTSPIDSAEVSGPSGPPGPTGHSDTRRRGRRSIFDSAESNAKESEEVEIIDEEISESVARQQPTEEQIADFLFAFLGLDSKACRRRFVCEMEFRSNQNPLTSMAFRIVGRGFFEKYTNARNPTAKASNFFECATVNPECIFIENAEAESESESAPAEASTETETAVKTEQESENEINLKAERRHAKLKLRRGDRKLSSILTQ